MIYEKMPMLDIWRRNPSSLPAWSLNVREKLPKSLQEKEVVEICTATTVPNGNHFSFR
jgi:hypothetical protein